MRTNSVFRWFSGIALLFGLMGQGAYAYSGKDSRNGADLPARGTLRVLVVFAEVTGDPNYNTNTWPWEPGKIPPNADQMFDADWWVFGGGFIGGGDGPLYLPPIIGGTSSVPTKRFSRFFYDASFGNLNVKGDYYPELIRIPYNQEHKWYKYDSLVVEHLASKPTPKSATGLKIPGDFDAWTPTGSYLEKNNIQDGKIDNLIIIWRVNSRLTTVNSSGQWWWGISSANGKIQSNYTQTMYAYDFLTSTIVPHEFSHGLLGGDQYHNGGAGAGTRHFMTNVGGYGIMESYNHNLRLCNAWDRYRLGWKKNDTYPDIYAHDLDGNIVNGDIQYRVPSAEEIKVGTMSEPQEYVLQDFLTTGDAIRIKLPYVGKKNEDPQWIWVENHVKDEELPYYEKGEGQRPMGVRINLQVGSDDFKSCDEGMSYNDGDYMRTTYYVPFSRFGRWDFEIYCTPVNRVGGMVNLPYIPVLDSIWIGELNRDAWYRANTDAGRSNAFTGNSLLESLKYDANGDGQLQDREEVTIKQVYKDNVRIGGDYPIFGNAYDVFRVGDTLSLATNPATTPWLTHKTVTGEESCTPLEKRDNRKIYLNGLRLHIKEKRTDGSVVVVVTQGYYQVNRDVRWCGDIVLNEKISLSAGKKINLTWSQAPVIKETPIVFNNKHYFTEPTILTCNANSVISLGKNSEITVDSLCVLVLKKNCLLEGSAQIRVKSGGTLSIARGASIGKGIFFIFEKGSYACLDSTAYAELNCRNEGYINGIHPYVRQMKKLYCLKGYIIDTKSGYVEEEPEDAPTPVYQSFFEGNPVYHQVGLNKTADGGYIPIYRQSLGGDTMVDGLLYHKMSVKDGWSQGSSRLFWVRESEEHDKVWVRLPWDTAGQEFLVVDMNIDKDDAFVMDRESEMITLRDTTWNTEGNVAAIVCRDTTVYTEICYVADSVYYLEHPGGVLKHIRLSPQGYAGYTKALENVRIHGSDCNWRSRHLEFIEGVGSNLGFVYRRLGVSSQDSLWGCLSWRNSQAPTDFIICMERDGGVYYEHPDVECKDCDDEDFDEWIYEPPYPPGWPANERVLSMSRHLSVSPNPAAATATLQWDASTDSRVSMAACRVTLYDMQGVRLRSYRVDSWPYTLSVSDLAPGGYLLRVVPVEAPAEGAWQATVRLMVR